MAKPKITKVFCCIIAALPEKYEDNIDAFEMNTRMLNHLGVRVDDEDYLIFCCVLTDVEMQKPITIGTDSTTYLHFPVQFLRSFREGDILTRQIDDSSIIELHFEQRNSSGFKRFEDALMHLTK